MGRAFLCGITFELSGALAVARRLKRGVTRHWAARFADGIATSRDAHTRSVPRKPLAA